MTLAVLASCALAGIEAPTVRVEVHLAPGLPSFTVVGLADTAVRESRERVRAALASSGYEFPAGRLTVNLAPADLPKESSRYDLPIAVGVLLASGQLALPVLERPHGSDAATPLSRLVLAGELSLTGALVPVAGALAMALSISRREEHTPGAQLEFILPASNASQAARVPGMRVYGAATLAEVVAHLEAKAPLVPAQAQPDPPTLEAPCLSDVRGQHAARRALEVAAAGGHNLLMLGAPGAGKSMLAQRLPGILPPLRREEALEAAAIAELGGQPAVAGRLAAPFGQRPFRSPHHSISSTALVGGGSRPKPGEITFAHLGILFLDELPEFSPRALETLREPMETGRVSIARTLHRVDYPARFQLVAAMNPCRCGWHGHPRRPCTCTPDRVAAYRARVSGPLLDRIDMQIEVQPPAEDWTEAPPGEPTESVRARVLAASLVQQARQQCSNAMLAGASLAAHCELDAAAQALWRQAMRQFTWSARAAHRVQRVARTIADLAGADTIGAGHIAEAIQYRRPMRGE